MSDSEDDIFFDTETGHHTQHTKKPPLAKQENLPKNPLTKPELALVFGPRHSFFFNHKKSWLYHPNRSGKEQAAIIEEWKSWGMQLPYIVALAPNGGWYTAYDQGAGVAEWNLRLSEGKCPKLRGKKRREWQKIHAENEDFRAWLAENIASQSDMVQSTVTFGPGDSYYARSPRAARWHDLPSDLEKEILGKKVQDGDSAPRMVALGKHGAWAALWPDGSCTWNLIKGYVSLHNTLRANEPEQRISFLALSPYDAGHHFLLWENGGYSYIADSAIKTAMQPHCEEYLRESARRKNTTYASNSGGKTVRTFLPDPIEQQKSDILHLQQENLELQAKAAKAEIKAAKAKTASSNVVVGLGVVTLAAVCVVM